MVRSLSQYFIEQVVDICARYIEECKESGDELSRDDMFDYVLVQDKRGVKNNGKVKSKRKEGPKRYTGYTLFTTIQRENIKSRLETEEDFRSYTKADGSECTIEFDGTPSLTHVTTIAGCIWREMNNDKKGYYNNLSQTVNGNLKELYGTGDEFTDEMNDAMNTIMKNDLNLTDKQISLFFGMFNKHSNKDKPDAEQEEEEVSVEPKKVLPKKKRTLNKKN